MYRKKIKFYNSILFRMSILVLGLGAGGILLITCFVKMQMRYNIEKQVTEEMQQIRDNSLLYVHQILLLNNAVVEKEGFEECVQSVMEQLESVGYRETAYYNLDGELLESSGNRFDKDTEKEDLKKAMEKDSTFALSYKKGSRCEVYFTMPVEIIGKRIGYIRYFFDYGKQYRREWNTFERTIWITAAVFALICFVTWVMLYRMLSAIQDLSGATSEISSRLADGEFDREAARYLTAGGRKDEIGELSGNFARMLFVAERQFQKIQEDNRRIRTLLNSRQEFYNNVTHELKTPLTTISGYAQLMEKNGQEDTELFFKGTGHILQESRRLHRMVVQLLEMQEEKEADEKKRLNLTELLMNVADTMQLKAGRRQNKIVLEGAEKGFLIEGREDKLRQVFINLIDNAIKYGRPKESIRLKITGQKGSVKISVANRGEGIRKEDAESIFEPFFCADRALSRELGSTGLGLSISKKIVEEHDGTISVTSTPKETTVFTVCFPDTGGEKEI